MPAWATARGGAAVTDDYATTDPSALLRPCRRLTALASALFAGAPAVIPDG